MLQSFTAISENGGENLAFSFWDYSGGYIVKNIEGLTPVPYEITSTPYAIIDGDRFQHSRRGPRNIVITLGLLLGHPEMSVQALRERLYSVFMTKSLVTLEFSYVTEEIRRIACRVETIEGDLFSEEPELVISLIAHDPDFKGDDIVIESSPDINLYKRYTIDYPGTVPTGIQMNAIYNNVGWYSGFVLDHAYLGTTQAFGFEIPSSKEVRVNTTMGERSIVDSVGHSLLSSLDNDSTWLTLQPGEQKLSFVTLAPTSFTFRAPVRYGAI